MSQVVHNYGDVCQAITEMAIERNAHIAADEFRMLNRCLDNAIASAVTEFSLDEENSDDDDGSEHAGLLGKKLRHSIRAARLAFLAIKSGQVGYAGSTGTLVHVSGSEP